MKLNDFVPDESPEAGPILDDNESLVEHHHIDVRSSWKLGDILKTNMF